MSHPTEQSTERRDRRRRLRLAGWSVLGLLLLVGLGSSAKAVADGVSGPDHTTSFTSLRDPDLFVEEMDVVLQRPVVILNRSDAVAQEVVRRSRTMTEAEGLRTASTIIEEADRLGYDPFMLLAVIHVESDYNHLAVSPVGAEGLMQLMPPTAEWMAERLDMAWPESHSFDPVLNIRLGTRYLGHLMRQFKRWDQALTAYNRGPRATRYHMRYNNDRLPKDIRDFYATKVLDKYAEYRALYAHLPAG